MLRAPTLNASRFVNSARSSHASSHGRVGTTRDAAAQEKQMIEAA
jgi:hypothetical protein